MVSPIQTQQSILQTNMVERVQQVQQQHPDMQQRYFEIQLREERKKMLQKVKTAEDTEQISIKDEEGRKHQAHDHQQKETETADLEQETSASPEGHGHVDVTV